jgi:hypothetical protein
MRIKEGGWVILATGNFFLLKSKNISLTYSWKRLNWSQKQPRAGREYKLMFISSICETVSQPLKTTESQLLNLGLSELNCFRIQSALNVVRVHHASS